MVANFIAELNDAILSRDADKLRKAIAHVERNNYTKRLAAVCCHRAVFVELFCQNQLNLCRYYNISALCFKWRSMMHP